MSVLVGGATGALITFLLTSGRWWWRRRRMARAAAQRLTPRLEALNVAISDALDAYSWQPLDPVELTDHLIPQLAITIITSLPRRTVDPFIDGVLAVQELDQARDSMTLATPQERDRVQSYQRRIDAARVIATPLTHRSARRLVASGT